MPRSTALTGTPSEALEWDRASGHLPFLWALADRADQLAAGVQKHVFQRPGTTVTYRGKVRVWRDRGWRGILAAWLLRLGVPARTMFPETGESVDFTMTHRVALEPSNAVSMTWQRSFDFGSVVRVFDATMLFLEGHAPIVDWLGAFDCLHVELHPTVQDGSIVVTSRREWLQLAFLRIPIPPVLQGRPYVRESEERDGDRRIHVEIHNCLLGLLFAYEGIYRRVPDDHATPSP